MASLLSGIGQGASGMMKGIGSAARSANTFMGQDVGGMTTPDTLPVGVEGPVRPSVGATGVNWGDILKAAQSGGNTRGMMPLLNNSLKKGSDLQEALQIAGTLWGGGI